jgi:hypothetical protein
MTWVYVCALLLSVATSEEIFTYFHVEVNFIINLINLMCTNSSPFCKIAASVQRTWTSKPANVQATSSTMGVRFAVGVWTFLFPIAFRPSLDPKKPPTRLFPTGIFRPGIEADLAYV